MAETPNVDFYQAYINPATMNVVGVVNWNKRGWMIERVDGEWEALPPEDDSFDGMIVARMSEEIVPVFDDAEANGITLSEEDIKPYEIPFEEESSQ